MSDSPYSSLSPPPSLRPTLSYEVSFVACVLLLTMAADVVSGAEEDV